jgi:hypothetical protein
LNASCSRFFLIDHFHDNTDSRRPHRGMMRVVMIVVMVVMMNVMMMQGVSPSTIRSK